MKQCDINQYIKYMIPKINKYYIKRDESHGLQHVINVTNNAVYIAKSFELTEIEYKIIIISSLLHDAYDSKYVTDKQNIIVDISNLLNDEGYIQQQIDLVHNIIKHISFTKEFNERKSNKEPLKIIQYFDSDKEQLLRDIVSDADKIESLGNTGIIRIIQYQNEIMDSNFKPKSMGWYQIHFHHLYDIYYNRIIILLTHNYIRTNPGKVIAKPLLDNMSKIFSNSICLYQYITDFCNKN